MSAIVTVTMNPALDKSTRAERVAAEQKLACRPPHFDPGGGGINVARAIRKLDGSAQAVSLLGGAVGDMVERLLAQEGVDHHRLPIHEMTRANLTVLDETSGQQYRFGMPGPKVREEEWRQLLDFVRGLDPVPDYVVASGSLPPGAPDDFYARLAAVVKEVGARFVVDTRGEPLRAAANAGVYLIKPNARELSTLAGETIHNEEEQEAAARHLVESGRSRVVVVSLGAAGVLLVTAEQCGRIRAPSVEPVSKIGAGDSTVAGMVLALVRGDSLEQAVRYGVAAGAAAVMSPGTALCRLEDVDRLYAQLAGED